MSQQSRPSATDLFDAFETSPKIESASFNSRRVIIDGTFLIVIELEALKLNLLSLLFSRSREETGEQIHPFFDISLLLRQLSTLKAKPSDFFLVSVFYMKWRF